MNHFYIIFIIYSTAVISFSTGEEVHAENNNSDKASTSSYTYSIEYSDAGNHGKYGHKIEVKDGSAKVNVHAQHPHIAEQVISTPKQQKIRQQPKPNVNHVTQQVLAYVPAQENQNAIPHQKEQPSVHHSPIQHAKAHKPHTTEKLPIETLDKHQLAILLAQNQNPFLPLTESKDVKNQQTHQAPATKYSTATQNKQSVSYYIPQGHNMSPTQYQIPAQPSQNTATYPDTKFQYTYQYQPASNPNKNNLVYDPKVQYASVANQQQYYYPETTTNQVYQNYYQHQIPATAHPTAQPQVQYTVPFAQNHQPQQQQQQYVYLPQTSVPQFSGAQSAVPQTSVPQFSGPHSAVPQSSSLTQLYSGMQYSGPVQFLPQHQSQNSHTYPTTPLYNIPKRVNVPSGTPELSAYPASLFSNVQYGSSGVYGSSAGYGTQTNIGYKPVVEAPQTGKANQYGSTPKTNFATSEGINYGSLNIQGNDQIQNGLYKQPAAVSAPVQTTKSSNFYATNANLPQGNHGNIYDFGNIQGTASNVAYKQANNVAEAPTPNQYNIDYSQLQQHLKQFQHLDYSTGSSNNQISNTKQQNSYITNIPQNNLQYTAPKSVPANSDQKNYNFGSESNSQYYNSPVANTENSNVRYVYVQASGSPQKEHPKENNHEIYY